MIQEIRPAVRQAETTIRSPATKSSRAAALPGAERRITRKRLTRPSKQVDKRQVDTRTAAT